MREGKEHSEGGSEAPREGSSDGEACWRRRWGRRATAVHFQTPAVGGRWRRGGVGSRIHSHHHQQLQCGHCALLPCAPQARGALLWPSAWTCSLGPQMRPLARRWEWGQSSLNSAAFAPKHVSWSRNTGWGGSGQACPDRESLSQRNQRKGEPGTRPRMNGPSTPGSS